MRVYLRKTQRIILGQVLTSLDIASIEVEERYYHRGLFSSFVIRAHETNPYQVTYLDHALNPVVRSWCIRQGWNCYANISLHRFTF